MTVRSEDESNHMLNLGFLIGMACNLVQGYCDRLQVEVAVTMQGGTRTVPTISRWQHYDSSTTTSSVGSDG